MAAFIVPIAIYKSNGVISIVGRARQRTISTFELYASRVKMARAFRTERRRAIRVSVARNTVGPKNARRSFFAKSRFVMLMCTARRETS